MKTSHRLPGESPLTWEANSWEVKYLVLIFGLSSTTTYLWCFLLFLLLSPVKGISSCNLSHWTVLRGKGGDLYEMLSRLIHNRGLGTTRVDIFVKCLASFSTHTNWSLCVEELCSQSRTFPLASGNLLNLLFFSAFFILGSRIWMLAIIFVKWLLQMEQLTILCATLLSLS